MISCVRLSSRWRRRHLPLAHRVASQAVAEEVAEPRPVCACRSMRTSTELALRRDLPLLWT